MTLRDTFELTRALFLYQKPLLTLDNAIDMLISEETSPSNAQVPSIDTTLATSSTAQILTPQKMFCHYCQEYGHVLLDCSTRKCRICHKRRPKHYDQDCPQ